MRTPSSAIRFHALGAGIATCLLSAPAFCQGAPGAPDMVRLSGTLQSFSGTTLTLKAAEGERQVTVAPAVPITSRVAGTLADIKPGAFVGSAAVQGPDGQLRAQEVHVFPDAMRGTGEGHRPMADANTTMTNGSVTTMTNGSVTASSGKTGAAPTITLNYPGGQQQITLPADVPVTLIKLVDRSTLKPGTPVNVMGHRNADGSVSAQMVQLGAAP